ncbi:FMN-binding glutamate synthase family protein, partial [Streptomyces sp. SAS_260]
MLRIGMVAVVVGAALAAVGLAVVVSPWWWLAAVPLAVLGVVGVWDLVQRRHSVLRNYPVIGHARFLLERIRPELQQYF